MVEVFSTNVKTQYEAQFLLQRLSALFPAYEMNFDLEDCDSILRVETALDSIEVSPLITLLKDLGFVAQVLSETFSFSKQPVPTLIPINLMLP